MNALWKSAGEVARQAVAEAEIRTAYPDVAGLSTGVNVIDEAIRPALEPGRLIVAAGASGRGKTALAAQLAVAFAQQVPTLWCSFEDERVDAMKRAVANVGRVPVSGLRSGFRNGAGPDAAYEAVELLDGLPMDLLDVPMDTVALVRTVYNWVKARAATGPLGGAIIIDQLSHIRMPELSSGERERLAGKAWPTPPSPRDPDHKVYEWQVAVLSEMARRLRVVVVLLHQLNQIRGEDGRPSESSIRGSQGIVQKADAVIIPWRPTIVENPFAGPGQPKSVPATEGAAELIVVKGRQIASGLSVQLRWDGAHQRFADPAEDAGASYARIAAPTAAALEGAEKLAALRRSFQAGISPELGVGRGELAASEF